MWIPVAIGIQFLLLYVVLGGPGRVLAGFSGQRSLLGIDGLGRLQIGLPVAMVLAFPSLAALAAIEKWWHSVGWLDIVLVQGGALILMLYRLRRGSSIEISAPENSGSDSQESSATASSTQLLALSPCVSVTQAVAATDPQPRPAALAVVESSPLCSPTSEIKAALPEQRVEGDVAVPVASSALAIPPEIPSGTVPPQGNAVDEETPKGTSAPVIPSALPLEPRQLARELAKIYGWNRVGLERPFAEARQHIRTWERGQAAADGRVASWRRIARDTQAALRQNGGALPLEEFFTERVLDADEYERDVMRRLSFSVLVGHDRLFIDPSDLEMCGEDQVVAMYREALLELGAEGGVTFH